MEIRGDVTMRDEGEQVKIELLSQWMLEAEFRNDKMKIRKFDLRKERSLISTHFKLKVLHQMMYHVFSFKM